MKTRTVIIASSAIVILTCAFAYGYLAYNRTVPVNYTPDQEKEMLLPLLVIFYGEADTPENRDKYRYMTADQIRDILNSAQGNVTNPSLILN